MLELNEAGEGTRPRFTSYRAAEFGDNDIGNVDGYECSLARCRYPSMQACYVAATASSTRPPTLDGERMTDRFQFLKALSLELMTKAVCVLDKLGGLRKW